MKIFYNDNGTMKCAAKLGGTSIAGATVYVPTQEFYVYWHTDGSQDSFYGFKIDSVTQGAGTKTGSADGLPGYTATILSAETYPESSHGNYGNNVNQLWKCTGPAVGTNTSFWQRIETVTKSEVSSLIEQSADSIRLQAKKIMWQSDYSSMTEAGKLTCTGAAIQGSFETKQAWYSSYKITKVEEGVIKGYMGDTQTGLLDMSAYYSDNARHASLKGMDYLHLQAGKEIKIEDPAKFIDPVTFTDTDFNADVNLNSSVYFGSMIAFKYQTTFNGTTTFNNIASFTEPPKLFNCVHYSQGGHVVFASDGATLAYAPSSSKRYKKHVRYMDKTDIDMFWKIPVVWFEYKEGYLSKEDRMYNKPIPGFYAEDMNDLLPAAARYQNDQVEDWNERMLIPYMVAAIQQLYPEHGHGILNEDGKCIILLNAIESQYYITLTKYGKGDLYISKKDRNSFIVTGTPDLEFDWQVTAA